jgi:hypothetical protein
MRANLKWRDLWAANRAPLGWNARTYLNFNLGREAPWLW